MKLLFPKDLYHVYSEMTGRSCPMLDDGGQPHEKIVPSGSFKHNKKGKAVDIKEEPGSIESSPQETTGQQP